MRSAPLPTEGFVGQHLVVVPSPVRRAVARHPLLRGMLVTDAGFFPRAVSHLVERPKGADTHLVISCLRGAGWVRTRAGERTVRAGDLVWLRAEQAHTYGADDGDPWTIAWAHFTGDEAEAWREHLGLGVEPASVLEGVSGEGAADLKLEQIYQTLEQGYAVPQLVAAAALLRTAFSLAAQTALTHDPARPAADRIALVRDHLRETSAKAHRLGELAAAAGLSVPHFSALFRRLTGYAPIDYLIRQRIQRACRLLDTTTTPVAVIAAEVGYEDPYYFTRCFRRVVGCSPRAYRRIPKG